MEHTIARDRDSARVFLVGDSVVYRAEGICDIVDIRKECFGANPEGDEYYILSPRNDVNSSIYVPVHNEALTALMRPILSREEIVEMLRELREERLDWPAESRARNVAFREILSQGDCRALVVLVLTAQERVDALIAAGKKPGSTETNALSRAYKMLRDEFSVAIPLHNDEELLALLRGEREI